MAVELTLTEPRLRTLWVKTKDYRDKNYDHLIFNSIRQICLKIVTSLKNLIDKTAFTWGILLLVGVVCLVIDANGTLVLCFCNGNCTIDNVSQYRIYVVPKSYPTDELVKITQLQKLG